jgi:secreted trypsin-like serine protease
MVSRIALSGVIVLLSSLSVRGGMILDGVSDSLYTSYASNFPSVGRLGNSSGVLIAPNWVLTAAHISNANMVTFQIGQQSQTVAQIVRHPQFTNINLGYDIALLRLTNPMVGVPSAKIYTGSSELGALTSISGFGATGVGSSNNPQNPGTFRAGTNIIETLVDFIGGAQGSAFATDFDAPVSLHPDGNRNTLGSADPTSLEYHLAGGDSGGGTFVFENGEWRVAGINSGVASQFQWQQSGANQLFGYGAVSVMTRVSSFQGFIASVSGVPEPGSLALLVFGFGMTAFAKRKLFLNLQVVHRR